jgi:hypothetical protein
MVITLSGGWGRVVRRLAKKRAIPFVQVVERGLLWTDVEDSLDPDERLAIHNRRTGTVEGIRLVPPPGSPLA